MKDVWLSFNHFKTSKLAKLIEDYFNNEGHTELPKGIMIVNLNLRSVVADDLGTGSLFKKSGKKY